MVSHKLMACVKHAFIEIKKRNDIFSARPRIAAVFRRYSRRAKQVLLGTRGNWRLWNLLNLTRP